MSDEQHDEDGNTDLLDLTGAPNIAGHLRSYVETLQEKVLIGATQQEVMQFALAVGIAAGKRLEKSKWKKGPDGEMASPGTQFGTYTGAKGIAYFLDSLGQIGDKSVVANVEEYLNGGLTYLKSIKFEEQSDDSWDTFYAEFPHLDPEEDDLEHSELGEGESISTKWPPSKGIWKTATWCPGHEKTLAGSERPGRKNSGDKSPVDRSEIEEWVAAAKKMDPPIKSIICLLTEKEMSDCYPCLEGEGGLIQYYQDQDFEVKSVGCEDYQNLREEQIQSAVDAFGNMPKPVLVHCSAAVGRTREAINKGIIPYLQENEVS